MALNNTIVALSNHKRDVCNCDSGAPRVPPMEGVKELRERLGLTQEQLALKLDCHPTTVSQIELGRMSPSLKLFARMVRALKVSAGRLLKMLIAAEEAHITNLQAERERRASRTVDH